MTDIRPHTKAICEALGLEPSLVKQLDLTPGSATATVYKTNERGEKYTTPESGFSTIATETRTYEIRA